MGSAILGWISRKGVAKGWISRKGTAGIISSARSSNCCGSKGAWISGVSVSDESVLCSSTLPSRISPWLMLPPAFEGGDMVYKFYSLAENKVLSLNKRGAGGGGEEELELPDDDSKFVGSSHGWLVLFNQRNCDLFLSNPLSRRHIKLPPIHTLPDPEINLRRGYGCVSKVIISCSPDKEECRAMMTFGPGNRLAFCLPGRSTEWTPIGDLFLKYETAHTRYARPYEDIVYFSRDKLFTCLTRFYFDIWIIEDWDLRIPRFRSIDWIQELRFEDEICSWWEENFMLLKSCVQVQYLVSVEQSDDFFLVIRFVMPRMGPNSSHASNIANDDICPYKTVGFSVYKIDRERVQLMVVERSLNGLAMFIGTNHSFVMSAAEFPELKPNSIYFTDAKLIDSSDDRPISKMYGGHDIGIFDYENKTISPCYYPGNVKRIVPEPMWFVPSPY